MATPNSRIFNVKNYGLKGDGTTNDVVAWRALIALVNANGGGTIEIPDGTYLFSVGDPASDSNYTTVASSYKAITNITTDNVTIRLSPKATINVVASFIYQNAAGPTTTNIQSLFYIGNGTTTPENFTIEGGGTFTFALTGGATYTPVDNGVNAFDFCNGKLPYTVWRDFTIDGFPRTGNLGGVTVGGQEMLWGRFQNLKLVDWGSAGHDNCLYVWGGTLFDACSFITSRKSSHAIYTGADKPGTVIRSCYFEGIQNIAAPQNDKYPIHLYATGGGAVRDITVENCTFNSNNNGILMQKDDGSTTCDRIVIKGNHFYGTSFSSGIENVCIIGHRLRDCVIEGNTITNYLSGIRLANNSTSCVIANNTLSACGGASNFNISANGTVTDLAIIGNSIRTPVASATCIGAGGTSVKIIGNSINLGTNASVSGIQLGITGAEKDNVISGNTISGAGISSAQAIVISLATQANLRMIGNTVNLTTAGIPFACSQACTNFLAMGNSLISASGTLAYSAALAGDWTWQRNYISATVSFQTAAGSVILFDNVISGTLSSTAAVARARGNLVNGAFESFTTTSTSYTPNAGLYRVHIVNSTTATTINAPTQATAGDFITFILTQPAGGGVNYTWNAVFKKNFTENTTANVVNTITFYFNGTNWLQTASVVNVA
jgi:parallel beta-helix repeat protein